MAPKTPALAPREAERAPTRKMTVIAQDPGVLRRDQKRILMATIEVPAEELDPGPIGYRVQIVDYDGAEQKFIASHELPASLEEEPKAWRDGDPKILDDYRFHAQNIYALVMKTLRVSSSRSAGASAGRSAPTSSRSRRTVWLDANAFYNPAIEGWCSATSPVVAVHACYTCLSHDVVVHETTHALLDALRERYLDPSSPDQAAFHEGFSDVIALLSVFSQPELVQATCCSKAGADRARAVRSRDATCNVEKLKKSALFGLAEQMGQRARGRARRAAARQRRDRAESEAQGHPEYLEPHRRGEVSSPRS